MVNDGKFAGECVTIDTILENVISSSNLKFLRKIRKILKREKMEIIGTKSISGKKAFSL